VSSAPFSNNGKAAAKAGGEPNVSGILGRLDASLARLEAAFEARLEREAGLLDAEAEVQRMGADRTRLAEALDSVEARARRLESTNREVSRRLVDAMEAIRTVLDRHPDGNA
jgi:hypothetical protein